MLTERKIRAQIIGGLATDLGAGGCYIATSTTLSKGTQVEVLLRGEGRILDCHAVVSYVVTRRGLGMGLAFTETVPDEWMRQLVPNGPTT